jgi:glycosyltransferase involved in cell wall biosynthesis
MSSGSASGPVRLTLFAMSPVYYQVPLYRLLAADPRLDFSVLYASSGGVRPSDAGYGQPIAWDTDLLGGYEAMFVARSEVNSIGDCGFFGLRDLDVVGRIRDLDPEVLWLFGYNYLSHQLAALTQKARRRPLLFREEQTLLEARPLWKRAIKAVAMRALFAGGRALYIGSRNRDWFAHYGVPPDRLFFTPYAVDNARLRADHLALGCTRSAIQSEFGIKENTGPVLLTVSRFIAKKQPLHLIEAFRRLRQEFDCTLLLVGSGPLEAEMREKVIGEQIPDVIFAGFINQSSISRAYAAADIFVLPSAFGETWGISVNEAMNFALPLVVTDRVGSAIDLVAEGENGFVVDHADIDAIVSRLRLLMNRDLRERFGAASLKRVEGHNYSMAASGVIRAVAAAVGAERWARAQAAASLT